MLLQGGLPTFVDIGSSFSASALAEDNLIEQLAAAGKRLAFVGDDTWMQLFNGSQFADVQPFPSFNVRDLHTVDDGVWEVGGISIVVYRKQRNNTKGISRRDDGKSCCFTNLQAAFVFEIYLML